MTRVVPAAPGKNVTTFTVFHINVQCLRNKIDLIDAFLIDKNYSVVSISEHWLTLDEIESIRFTNYTIVSSFCRGVRQHGGVLILARKGLRCEDNTWIVDRSMEFVCELSSITVPDLNLVVVTAYRTGNCNLEIFENIVGEIFERVFSNVRVSVVFNGDFNVHFNKPSNTVTDFSNFLGTFGLRSTINEPTRLNNCLL